MKNPRERIIIAAFLLLSLFVVYSLIIFSSAEPKTSARSAVLYEPETECFLYSKNADERLAMASTTKIMTALVAIERAQLDEDVRVADGAIGIEGSSLYLKQGETLTLRSLLIGLMLRSANDAAAAIAYHISGGISEFAELMNARARELGLSDTHFTNPHGLDDKDHYTTARELALIAAEAMRNDVFKEIVSSKKEVIKNAAGEARLIINHNKLLSMYEGAVGVKTGFTKKCGRCLVGAAERNGLQYITVTINAPDDWNDHIAMLNYGYSLLEKHVLAKIGQFSYKVPVIGDTERYLSVSNTDEISVILKKGAADPKILTEMPRYIAKSVNKGDVIGHIIFKSDGNEIARLPLIAEEDVQIQKRRGFFSIFN